MDATSGADVGVTGLAVMGRNLARNMARHGYTVAIHNRTAARVDDLVREHGDEGVFVPSHSLPDFVSSLKRPRRVVLMLKAGAGTDAVLNELVPLLDPGDIVVDGGNAHFDDTRRREAQFRESGLHFVGTGISGGEEGALHGPSIMPGGARVAYEQLEELLTAIAADVDGVPCCAYVGPDAAGHFVKMVHNGIEYADMQLIAEAYDLLRHGSGLRAEQLADVFAEWNSGDLESFLIESAARVLRRTDPNTGTPFVDVIVDAAEQKGTGMWTVQSALDLGVPVPTIAEAVFARSLSGHGGQRNSARRLPGPDITSTPPSGDEVRRRVEDVRQALYAARLVAYAQGFDQIRAASEKYTWNVDLAAIATIWRGGCIIRARILGPIRDAFSRDAALPSLLTEEYFAAALADAQIAWRRVVCSGVTIGVPVPCLASALAYYDGLRRERLPTTLIQGLRDLFGSHTYARLDQPGTFHTDWSGDGDELRQGADGTNPH